MKLNAKWDGYVLSKMNKDMIFINLYLKWKLFNIYQIVRARMWHCILWPWRWCPECVHVSHVYWADPSFMVVMSHVTPMPPYLYMCNTKLVRDIYISYSVPITHHELQMIHPPSQSLYINFIKFHSKLDYSMVIFICLLTLCLYKGVGGISVIQIIPNAGICYSITRNSRKS